MKRNDYIHANYVDGYKQSKAYISTQGPLDSTIVDFWQMIWQQCVLVIAMTTKCYEMRKLKCAQYWPLDKGAKLKLEDLYELHNTNVEDLGDYRVTYLTIRHLPVSLITVFCSFVYIKKNFFGSFIYLFFSRPIKLATSFTVNSRRGPIMACPNRPCKYWTSLTWCARINRTVSDNSTRTPSSDGRAIRSVRPFVCTVRRASAERAHSVQLTLALIV